MAVMKPRKTILYKALSLRHDTNECHCAESGILFTFVLSVVGHHVIQPIDTQLKTLSIMTPSIVVLIVASSFFF
jgi:uncharacterized protein YqkB